MGRYAYARVTSDGECPADITAVWQFYDVDGTADWYDEPEMRAECV